MRARRTQTVAAGAASWLLPWIVLTLSCGADQRAWNVLLVTWDTTRADHIGAYGNQRASTPHLDRLAKEGVLFENAYSALPLTLPSHSTMLTGLYPPAHGVRDNGLFVLSEQQVTLAEVLAGRGYATGAAIGGFPLESRFGIGQGFSFYDDHLTAEREDAWGRQVHEKQSVFFDERPAAQVNEAIMPWLTEHADEPFFAWVHYYDPHQPQQPPKPYDQVFADNPYLGEIAYADENLGHLLRHLERLDVLDDTIVIVTADHGEGLGEHRELTHAYLLYDTTQRVPLVLRLPTTHPLVPASSRIETRVSSVDLFPTVLSLVDLEIPPGLHGRTMTDLLRTGEGNDRLHYAETLSPRFNNDWGELRALYEGSWKYVHGPKPELFDLTAERPEYENLASLRPEVAGQMKSRLAELIETMAERGSAEAVQPDEETTRRLQALGYLQGGGSLEVVERLRDEGTAPQDRVDDINAISRVRQALFEGDGQTGVAIARSLLLDDPENKYYLELLAQAYGVTSQVDLLLGVLDQLVELGATSGTAERLMLSAGKTLFVGGRRADGLARIRQSLELVPHADGFQALGTLLSSVGEREEALAALRSALELDPLHAQARNDLAAALARKGDVGAAEEEFRRLLADHPFLPKAHYNLGVFVFETGDADAAEQSFERAIELDAEYWEAWYALALSRLTIGRVDDALRIHDQFVATRPDHPVTHRLRALFEE